MSLVAGVIIWGRVLCAHLFSCPQEEAHCTAVFTSVEHRKATLKGKSYCIIETALKISLFFDNVLFFDHFIYLYVKLSKYNYTKLSKNLNVKICISYIYKYRCIHIYVILYIILCLCVCVKHSLIIPLLGYAFFPSFTPHWISSSLAPSYFHALWLPALN